MSLSVLRRALTVTCLVATSLFGCGDDAGTTSDGGSLLVDAGPAHDEDAGDDDAGNDGIGCSSAANGDACGRARHCENGACLPDTCGDGYAQADEACDDGNESIADGCDPACRVIPLRCGDGKTQDDEECDDGNRFDLDDCSVACTHNACGNKRTEGLEECDDGNLVNDDDCSDACTENRCRNGRLDFGEECDDGNRTNDDDCTNACLIEICGNDKTEVKEECDDGNLDDDDGCSNACTKNVCGNSRIDPGEACDGDTVAYNCSDDCTGITADVCRPCEEDACDAYLGELDLVAGCFDGAPRGDLVPIVDSMFDDDCIAVIDCARQHGCGYDDGAYGIECYCGSRGIDDCISMGPASDAPCVAEWQAATRQTSPSLVLGTFTDLSQPSGWAAYTLECDLQQCESECVP